MRSAAKRWPPYVSAILAAVLLVQWWGLVHNLTPAERLVIGIWHHPEMSQLTAPDETLVVWAFAPDRTCRVHAVHAVTGEILNQCDYLRGRWCLEYGMIVCDWENGMV